jgi:hypothetical protein
MGRTKDHKVVATTNDERDKILERLTKIRHEFEKLSGISVRVPLEPRELILFGLTLDEAKEWIANEPNFIPRRPPDKLPVYLGGGGMPVAINTIPILNCDGNPHIWVSGVSKRVLTRLAGV